MGVLRRTVYSSIHREFFISSRPISRYCIAEALQFGDSCVVFINEVSTVGFIHQNFTPLLRLSSAVIQASWSRYSRDKQSGLVARYCPEGRETICRESVTPISANLTLNPNPDP